MNWIFDKSDEPNTMRMLAAAQRAGMGTTQLEKNLYAFGALDKETEDLSPAPIFRMAPVLTYGDTALVRAVQRYVAHSGVGWAPVAWAPWEDLRCSAYLGAIGSISLQQRWTMRRLRSLADPRVRDQLFEVFGSSGCLFVRPDENDKRFSGGIVERERWDDWQANVASTQGLFTRCLVARPEPIGAEWRCFMVGDSVVTSSQYRIRGRLDYARGCPPDAERAAALAIQLWEDAPPACVVDIAETGGEFRVIEVGSINCTGLYAADEDVLVEALGKLAAERYETP